VGNDRSGRVFCRVQVKTPRRFLENLYRFQNILFTLFAEAGEIA
jgi:hypothetical protein